MIGLIPWYGLVLLRTASPRIDGLTYICELVLCDNWSPFVYGSSLVGRSVRLVISHGPLNHLLTRSCASQHCSIHYSNWQ